MQDAWLTAAVHDCKARPTRYIETLGARRRYLPDITARKHRQRSRAERQAVNGICQARPAERLELVGSLTCDWSQGQEWVLYVPFVVLFSRGRLELIAVEYPAEVLFKFNCHFIGPRVQGISGLRCEACNAYLWCLLRPGLSGGPGEVGDGGPAHAPAHSLCIAACLPPAAAGALTSRSVLHIWRELMVVVQR